MSKAWLFTLVMALFILEGTAVQLFVPQAWGIPVPLTPRFVLVAVVYIALYMGRRYGLWFGVGFGLLQDLLYSDIIGVYAFSMGIIGYFSGIAFLLFHPSILLLMLTFMGCIFLHEVLIYGFFLLFGIIQTTLESAFFEVKLFSIILNVIFALAVYYPFTNLLQNLKEEYNQDE